MIKPIAVFGILVLLGLALQSIMFHSFSFAVVAPDFIVALVVFVGIHYHSPLGVFGAFVLGLLGDFASGQFMGPNAAGCVIAYNVAALVSQKLFAEHPLTLVLLAAVCALAKTLVMLLVIQGYTQADLLTGNWMRILMEIALTGLITPVVAKLLLWSLEGRSMRLPKVPDSLRWVTRSR